MVLRLGHLQVQILALLHQGVVTGHPPSHLHLGRAKRRLEVIGALLELLAVLRLLLLPLGQPEVRGRDKDDGWMDGWMEECKRSPASNLHVRVVPIHVRLQLQVLLLQEPILLDLLVQLLLLLAATPLVVLPLLLLLYQDKIPTGRAQVLMFPLFPSNKLFSHFYFPHLRLLQSLQLRKRQVFWSSTGGYWTQR